MKQLSYTLVIILVLSCININSYAKVWRVNNTGVPANFTTAQAAADAAQVLNDDTLHLEPSGAGYGNLTLNKRLVIIGNGFYLGGPADNTNAGFQANTANSKLGSVFFNLGSSGSIMMGMSCGDVIFGTIGAVDHIVLKRNYCSNIVFGPDGSSHILVAQNYVTGFVGGGAGAHTNLAILSNLIGTYASFTSDDNGMFANNIIGANPVGSNYISLTTFMVRNNIRLKNPAPQAMSLTSCTIQNNMDCTGNSGFGTIDGNLGNVDMSTVFLGWPDIGNNSFDGRFILKDTSPAKGSGYGGADMGAILNTSNPNNNVADSYVLSGMPNIPSIFKLDGSGTISTSTLNLIISTRTNY